MVMGLAFHTGDKSRLRSAQRSVGQMRGISQRPTPVSHDRLQRKADRCACGGSCPRCQEQLPLQKKLAISEPDDQYEQEADRIAEAVLAAPTPPAVHGLPPRIQRFAGQPTGQAEAASASVEQVLASPGRPLEPVLRQDMEQCFGHDFSRVRVHSGAVAEQSARDVNAHAYTVGHDMVFGAGQFAPGMNEGRRLIAHELTHVVQQSGADEIRLDQSDEKRGLSPISPISPKLRGHGEEPKPADPAAPRAPDPPSSSPPPGPSCRCSNLRLGEDVYQDAQKKVKLLFDVESRADPHQCVLVQSVIGEKFLSFTPEPYKADEKIHPLSIAILGTPQLFNFFEWQIDSNDKDPVVWSKPSSRWNYQRESEHTFYATDSPSALAPYPEGARFAVSAAKFRTSLYCAADVPITVTSASSLPAPLASVEWEDSTCWEHGKEPTHPGFGKACSWAPVKPGE